MEPSLLALIGIVVMFILMILRMPISFAMFIVGFVGLVIMIKPNAAFNLLSGDIWLQFSGYTLSVIPMYVLMGEIVFRTGITDKLFNAAYKWIGQFKGGMACTAILASAGFGSISGSNGATAATMGTIALPQLKKYRYDDALSTGSVAAGGTLGVIIPPSTVLIILAIQTSQSVSDLFIAIMIPSILLTVLMLLTVIYLCQRNPELGPAGEKFSWKEKIVVLKDVVPVLLLFFFVVGGLFLGWFTPTESGAVGTFGAIVLTLLMKKLTWKSFKQSIPSTLKTSAMIVMLVASATIFGRFLAVTRLPYEVAEWVNALPVSNTIILIAILIIFVIGGALMDALGFLIIGLPIFFPTVIGLGYDPVWFCIILCIVTSLGAITPPVGMNVFIVKGLVPDISISTVFRGTNYFFLTYAVLIALLIVFPVLVWIPK